MDLALLPLQPIHKNVLFKEGTTMPAILEQLEQSLTGLVNMGTPLSASYNLAANEVHIQVLAFSSTNTSSGIDFIVPPCAVKNGIWTLIWDLVLDSSLSSAQFSSIDFTGPIPSGVEVQDEPAPVSGTQWTATIKNTVTSVNGFSYTIWVAHNDDVKDAVRQDPSIAVVQDPIVG
jgi:hypothetical protein